MLRARLGRVEVGLGLPVRIIGAINVSPESFYGGSVAASPEDAVRMASRMLEEGADVIDVGGMSTAPYVDSRLVPPEVEASRVVPAVRAISRELGAVVSVDTIRARVAEAAIGAGAEVVNDVSGCKADPEMARVVGSSGASAILGEREEETPAAGSPIESIRRGLSDALRICESAGVDPSRVAVDPGIGFFRRTGMEWHEWDAAVLRGLGRLLALLRPIVIGVSRKSFIGKILGLPDPRDRLIGTVAAEAIAVFAGAHAVRAHDVREAAQAARIGEALRAPPRSSGAVLDLTRLLGPEDGVAPGEAAFAVPARAEELAGPLGGIGGRAIEVAPGATLAIVPIGSCGRLRGSGNPALESMAELCA
ncbi:MAG: dihydropteroate synthase [Nitrososphaeria archaeon]